MDTEYRTESELLGDGVLVLAGACFPGEGVMAFVLVAFGFVVGLVAGVVASALAVSRGRVRFLRRGVRKDTLTSTLSRRGRGRERDRADKTDTTNRGAWR